MLAPIRRRLGERTACLLAWFAAAALLLAAPFAHGQAWQTGTDGLLPIPPVARVTDLTQTLRPDEIAALDAKLADWESRTTNQLVVLMVPTTQPEPIESYALRVAEAWKIGRKGQDNGAVFLIAKDDRKMRIEVGYGLEGTLTDVTSRRIIAENVAPAFREGRFAAGINAGIDRIISVVSEGKPLPPPKAQASRGSGGGFNFDTLMILLVAVPLVGSVLRSIFGRLLGSTVGAGVIAAIAWIVVGSLAIAVIAAIVGFIVMIFASSGILGRGGGWTSGRGGGLGGGYGGGGFGGGGGWSGGGGGGGFSGGGGSFGGGGASGNW
jgi:uncharacterized protein